MSLESKNFAVDDVVFFVKTMSPLDGRFGTILGKSVEGVVDFYVVLLDEPYAGQKGVNISESCLQKSVMQVRPRYVSDDSR